MQMLHKFKHRKEEMPVSFKQQRESRNFSVTADKRSLERERERERGRDSEKTSSKRIKRERGERDDEKEMATEKSLSYELCLLFCEEREREKGKERDGERVV